MEAEQTAIRRLCARMEASIDHTQPSSITEETLEYYRTTQFLNLTWEPDDTLITFEEKMSESWSIAKGALVDRLALWHLHSLIPDRYDSARTKIKEVATMEEGLEHLRCEALLSCQILQRDENRSVKQRAEKRRRGRGGRKLRDNKGNNGKLASRVEKPGDQTREFSSICSWCHEKGHRQRVCPVLKDADKKGMVLWNRHGQPRLVGGFYLDFNTPKHC
ncbi:hypothetical protein MaudCBS49596_003953 [Microsporum audouinii]